jgi:hypothetical protein
MPIKLNGETSGSIELDVPAAVGSDLQLTLPATAGEVIVKEADGSVDLGDVEIDSSGRLLVGTTSAPLDAGYANLQLVSADGPSLVLARNDTGTTENEDIGAIRFYGNDGGTYQECARIAAEADGSHDPNDKPTYLRFLVTADGASSPTEAMRIDNTGKLLVGKTSSGVGTRGAELRTGDNNYAAAFTTESHVVVLVNRNGDDGSLIQFRGDNVTEGAISIGGSSVTLQGAHLSRWSQLAGGVERTEILRGSVLSNLDEMCVWAYDAQDAVLYTEDDELPEGVSVGDVKTPAVAAGTENNEQLNRMQVSDVEGDKDVSGVFQSWDDDDDTYLNDFTCAMTGDFVIRIAQGTTVARGDLLMSAGDGTAKPQDDDIVRSKTIAKVTSTTVSETYSDGSYCVPCVLMAC